MNKKFSTLMASLLLAGGLFGTVNAQELIALSSAAERGGYYSIKLDTREPGTQLSSWHVTVTEKGALVMDKVGTGSPEAAAALWKAAKVNVNGQDGWTFVNAEGTKLTFDKNGKFNAEGKGKYYAFTISGHKLYPVGESNMQLTQNADNTVSLTSTGTKADTWTVATEDVTATANNKLGKGFSITIGKQKSKDGKLVWDGAYELEGNVFTGKLTLTENNELMNEAGRYIVLTKNTWGTLSNDLQATDAYAGYKFATMTPAALSTDLKKGDKSTVLASTFRITQPNLVSEEPLEVVAYSPAAELSDDEKATGYELKVAIVDGKAYLTTGKAAKGPQRYTDGDASYTYEMNQGVVINNTYVKFGDGNDVDYAIFNDALWNISWKNADGKVLVAGPSCSYTWVPAAQVATAYPEGQWLWNGEAFVNRESGYAIPIDHLRKTDKDLVFTGDDGVYTFVKAGELGETNLGYLDATDDDLLKEAFYIGTPVKATNDIVYIAKADNGALYLTTDKAAAVEFRLKKETWTDDNDLVRHYTDYATSKKNFVAKDTLNLHKYFVSEAATGANLAYDKTNQIFILSKDAKQYQSLVFKNKAEGIYNLVQSLATAAENDTKQNYLNQIFDEFCKAKKLYGAHNTAELKQADKAYAYVANDLFILEKVDAGQHVSGIEGKNIKIMRNADNNYVLYETGSLLETENEVLEGFLGIQNFLDPKYSEKNAAMYVDPAAGMDTWRPEYMLVLNPKFVEAGKWCPIHGDDPTCPDAHKVETRGYSEGRYLVNLVDSAANRADCVFQNYSGDNYYRLGFVQAKHIGDTLAIASTGDSLNLTGNDFAKMNVAEFAFHYTDGNRDAFTIETAYKADVADANDVLEGRAENVGELMDSTKGYVKFHNGIPVVTKEASEAEVFVLAETEEAPTANEAIEATGVQVIGGQGAVTVQGAAGKVITVANILGQTIANQVAASDNVTITAPAGVVVVAVEGEATKVVVK
ncbi:MAG: DUF6383 domain-containing protein [bacterium]|nr:DUF6383 domain-containing protein [bacterium]